MRYAFRVKSTFLAEVAMDRDKQRIVEELVSDAEKLGLGENDYAVFDVPDLGLKAVVRFASRIIHVMTREEYEKTGLPNGAKTTAAPHTSPPQGLSVPTSPTDQPARRRRSRDSSSLGQAGGMGAPSHGTGVAPMLPRPRRRSSPRAARRRPWRTQGLRFVPRRVVHPLGEAAGRGPLPS
jgi:hypothetical protein